MSGHGGASLGPGHAPEGLVPQGEEVTLDRPVASGSIRLGEDANRFEGLAGRHQVVGGSPAPTPDTWSVVDGGEFGTSGSFPPGLMTMADDAAAVPDSARRWPEHGTTARSATPPAGRRRRPGWRRGPWRGYLCPDSGSHSVGGIMRALACADRARRPGRRGRWLLVVRECEPVRGGTGHRRRAVLVRADRWHHAHGAPAASSSRRSSTSPSSPPRATSPRRRRRPTGPPAARTRPAPARRTGSAARPARSTPRHPDTLLYDGTGTNAQVAGIEYNVTGAAARRRVRG